MYTITISAQELQNLKGFMSRINLSAKEVNAFVEVVNKLNTAVRVEAKAEEKTETVEEEKA